MIKTQRVDNGHGSLAEGSVFTLGQPLHHLELVRWKTLVPTRQEGRDQMLGKATRTHHKGTLLLLRKLQRHVGQITTSVQRHHQINLGRRSNTVVVVVGGGGGVTTDNGSSSSSSARQMDVGVLCKHGKVGLNESHHGCGGFVLVFVVAECFLGVLLGRHKRRTVLFHHGHVDTRKGHGQCHGQIPPSTTHIHHMPKRTTPQTDPFRHPTNLWFLLSVQILISRTRTPTRLLIYCMIERKCSSSSSSSSVCVGGEESLVGYFQNGFLFLFDPVEKVSFGTFNVGWSLPGWFHGFAFTTSQTCNDASHGQPSDPGFCVVLLVQALQLVKTRNGTGQNVQRYPPVQNGFHGPYHCVRIRCTTHQPYRQRHQGLILIFLLFLIGLVVVVCCFLQSTVHTNGASHKTKSQHVLVVFWNQNLVIRIGRQKS